MEAVELLLFCSCSWILCKMLLGSLRCRPKPLTVMIQSSNKRRILSQKRPHRPRIRATNLRVSVTFLSKNTRIRTRLVLTVMDHLRRSARVSCYARARYVYCFITCANFVVSLLLVCSHYFANDACGTGCLHHRKEA